MPVKCICSKGHLLWLASHSVKVSMFANVDGLPRDCKRRLVASSENFFHPPVHYGDASFE